MRILVSTALLSPYRTDWLNELAKYADVSVFCLYADNSERNKEWLAKQPDRCKLHYMQGWIFPKIGKISFDIIAEMKRNQYDIIILDGYGYATQLINILFLNRHSINYYVNIDGIVKKNIKNSLSEGIKKRIISSIPNFLCGSYATNEILYNLGAKPGSVINHPFTSLYEHDIYLEPASLVEKDTLRNQLNIKEKKVVISVGRFSYLGGYGKGYDVLLKAAKQMGEEFGWYIVGGSPTKEFAEMKTNLGLDNVHFIKHTEKEELKKYYRAADVFVLMTVGDVWGLVVNEAMACGLPVITTEKCMAGLDLIKKGVNGYILQVGDVNGLVSSIQSTIKNNKTNSMGRASIQMIKDYTIERLAKVHMAEFSRSLQ